MTWARGSTTLPAAHTPGTLVRPVASVVTRAVVVDIATEVDDQSVVRDEAGRNEQGIARNDPAVVHPHATESVVVDDQLLDFSFDHADRSGDQLRPLCGVEVSGGVK
jgi:hypothetical protein